VKKIDYYTNNKLKSNIKDYRSGKRDLSVEELNDIKLYISKYKDVLENSTFYTGTIKEYNAISCFADSFYEELHTRMINNYNADIAIIVNITEKKIFFKKNNNTCQIDLCKLSHILCNGTCIESSTDIAIGELTDNFINLTKKFTPCL
jgi:hypothetical protein